MKTLTTTQIVNYTNARLNNWYENAKEDYSVNGQGSAVYNEEKDMIVITYTEDGVTGVFELGNFQTEAIDWVFNVWSEMANLEDDKIETTPEFRTSFTDCDDFATYVLDYLTDFGELVTKEFNDFLSTDFAVGADLFKITDFPNAGKNYEQFGSVRSWLYDIYESKFMDTKKDFILETFQIDLIKNVFQKCKGMQEILKSYILEGNEKLQDEVLKILSSQTCLRFSFVKENAIEIAGIQM